MDSNIEIIRNAYASFAQGNIPAILDILDDDIEWELPSSAQTSFSGVFRGKKEVLAFFDQVAKENDFREFTPMTFIADGPHVIVLGYAEAATKRTAKISRNKWAHHWVLTDGKAVQHYEYVDTAEIRDAFRD